MASIFFTAFSVRLLMYASIYRELFGCEKQMQFAQMWTASTPVDFSELPE